MEAQLDRFTESLDFGLIDSTWNQEIYGHIISVLPTSMEETYVLHASGYQWREHVHKSLEDPC